MKRAREDAVKGAIEVYDPLKVYTTQELADLLKIGYDFCRELLMKGTIKSYQPFKKSDERRIRARDVYEYLYPEDGA